MMQPSKHNKTLPHHPPTTYTTQQTRQLGPRINMMMKSSSYNVNITIKSSSPLQEMGHHHWVTNTNVAAMKALTFTMKALMQLT
jgi:hypothetical protein